MRILSAKVMLEYTVVVIINVLTNNIELMPTPATKPTTNINTAKTAEYLTISRIGCT
jgi:hypothetical protein